MESKSTANNPCVLSFDILTAIACRVFIIGHSLLTAWRLNVIFQNNYYWLFLLGNIFVIAECFYSIIKRQGKDSRWISMCFVIFLCCAIPPIWLLELNRHSLFYNTLKAANATITVPKDVVQQGIESLLSFQVKDETWVMLIEESVVYIVIIGRWCLPRGDVSREQLSQLLFVFIGIASDIMELFALFGEDAVRLHLYLNYAILAVWSLSLFQFTMVLTISKKHTRHRDEESIVKAQKHVLRIELLTLAISLFLQDGPFLAIRAFTIYKFNLITYSLMFFLVKNILVVLLIFYRGMVLCCTYCCGEDVVDGKVNQKKRVFARDQSNDTVFVMPTFVAISAAASAARYSDISFSEEETVGTGIESASPAVSTDHVSRL